MTRLPPTSFAHLMRLSNEAGIAEHAIGSEPRTEMGCCTDDAGRLLEVAVHAPREPGSKELAELALTFLEDAHEDDGCFRLRRTVTGGWTDDPPSDDACGRALFGLGAALADAVWPSVRTRARSLFRAASAFRSPFPRATAYAAVGGAFALAGDPDDDHASGLLARALDLLPPPGGTEEWPWPWERLTYANALLPEAQIRAGSFFEVERALTAGLGHLRWLTEAETGADWYSPTPVGGRGRFDPPLGFDQQPIEAAHMTAACEAAWDVTGEKEWLERANQVGEWFLGRNATGLVMYDIRSGGGYDGLGPDYVNSNQGAESTLAFLSTMSRMHRIDQAINSAVGRR